MASERQTTWTFDASAFGWELTDMPDMDYVMARSVGVDDKHMPMGAFGRIRDTEGNIIGLYESQS